MADPAEGKPEADQDMGGMITFVPDLSLDGMWLGLPFEIDIEFEADPTWDS